MAKFRDISGRLLPLLLALAMALAAFDIFGGPGSRVPAELASGQWQRLTSRMLHDSSANQGRARRLPLAPLAAEIGKRQSVEYQAHRAKTVVELQPFRRTSTIQAADGHGRVGTATLINLNPKINAWYLLELSWPGEPKLSYHLTNLQPAARDLVLDADFPTGLVLADSAGREGCELWADDSSTSLAAAGRRASPSVALCDERVALRRATVGRRTRLEWAADFLRDHVWVGESLTVLVRDSLFADAHLVGAKAERGKSDGGAATATIGRPVAAQIAEGHEQDRLPPAELGLAMATPPAPLQIGSWTALKGNPGIFVSAIQPGLAARMPGPRRIAPLDEVEATAQTYLVAFDLSRFEIAYALGTDHPRVGWSDRVRPDQRDDKLPGPDGIGDFAPLVASGIIPETQADRTVASFTGGFKRSHGAFKSGTLGSRASGSHYGFVESGVVLSKLQPGLATIFQLDDGALQMKTWTREDDALLERVRFARQNGVPIVEKDPATGLAVPGALVGRWGDGNWSGSEDKRLRSVRAGVCLQESAAGRFLLYGYFSSATPGAMARIFLAYGCDYAMITDMNALEHTYLALYRVEGSRLVVDHMIRGMEVLDQEVEGQVLPRFLGFADNRDFFYVLRRPAPAPSPESAVAARKVGP